MRGGLGTTRAPRAGPATSRTPELVPGFVQWTFYLFVFSIPFEYPDRSIPVEITTLTGALFLLAAVLRPARCFRWPPSALWLFLIYVYVYWVAVAAGGGLYTGDAAKSFVTLFQMILIFWAAANILQDVRVANRALMILAVACVILAAMTLLGIMTKAGMDADTDTVRVTVLGQNANRAARILLSGLLVLVGLTYGRDRPLIRPRFLIWPLVALIAVALIKGGSRGGLLALAVGLGTFVIAGPSVRTKVRNAVVALVAIATLLAVVIRSPLIQRRFTMAGEGNFAKREYIFPNAVRMFLERPLLGWGNENQYELVRRLPREWRTSRDMHNLVLHVLTTTGLLGGVPFLGGLLLAVRAAWKGRRGPMGVLPLALLIALLAGNMSGNYIVLKLQWVALALAFASGAMLVVPSLRPATPSHPRLLRVPSPRRGPAERPA